MSYRGDDLDLRVPTDRSSAPAGQVVEAVPATIRPMFGASARDTTIWVDETLLACCNNAFDLALAHGANEVRVEHLIHAFTQVDAAARVLTDCGLNVGRMRRESTILIVSENPVSFDASRGPPRRSTEFEETLRHATELAQRRGGLAGVEDALLALLTSERGSQTVDLVRRLAPDWQSREWAALREPARAMPMDTARRLTMVSDRTSDRLNLIESTLRGIHSEIAGDRKLLSDLVRELHREITNQRGDGAALSNTLVNRLATIERQLAAQPEPLRLLPEVTGKLQSIEQAVQSGMGEGARNWAALDKRLKSLEQAISKADDPSDAVEPIVKRLAALEQVQQDRAGDSVRSWVALADRVQSLEKLYQAGSTEAIRQWSALSEGNATILKSLADVAPASPVDAAALTERLELIERTIRSGFGDTVRSNAILADRVSIVERVIGSRNDTESTFLLDERMRALEVALDGRAKETGNRWLELVDRLKSIETRVRDLPDAGASAVAVPSAEALAAPIVTHLSAVTSAAQARDDSHARAIAEIGGRVSALEHVVQGNIAALNAAAKVYDRNADELHEGFVRLSENQHTLASAIGDWRDDSTAEFRKMAGGVDRLKAIEERLDTLTRYLAAPTQAFAVPQRAENASARRGAAITSSGFWRWLFGTDDIRQANLNAELKWQQMREKVRAAGDKLRKR